MIRRDREVWLSPARKPEQSDSLWELLGLGSPDEVRWMRFGLCMETDPDAFYPEKGESTRRAKSMCVMCPVRIECRDYAVARNERFGVWGGLSEQERRPLVRERRAEERRAA